MSSAKVLVDTDIQSSCILRRYMDLPKLLDMLHSRSLYFRRADGFSDRLEGALFPSLRASKDDAHAAGVIDTNADYFYRRSRVGSFVSCWTRSAKDSMAHWQLYAGVHSGVVVTTTVDRLIQTALAWERDVIVHRVRYVDHLKVKDYVIGRYSDVLQYKHEAYRHENEVRVIVPQQDDGWESNPIELRLSVPDLDILVRSIVVAPEASSEFYEAIKDLCLRYGLKAPVRRSKLAYVPV